MVVREKQCCCWRKLGLGLLPAAARAWVSIGGGKTWLFLLFSLLWVGFFFFLFVIVESAEKRKTICKEKVIVVELL